MDKKEKQVQDALGTTPYLLRDWDDKSLTSLFNECEKFIRTSKSTEWVHGWEYGWIWGMLVGGLSTATSLPDIDHLINFLEKSSKSYQHAFIDLNALCKCLKDYFRN